MKNRLFLLLFALWTGLAWGQDWQHLPPGQAQAGSSLDLDFSRVAGSETPSAAILFLELDGEGGPSLDAVYMDANTLEFRVPADRTQGTRLSYWVEIDLPGGALRLPESGRYEVNLVPATLGGDVFLLLSAEETLPGGPVLLAFAPQLEDLGGLQLLINGEDRSEGLESDPWLITWLGDLGPGDHTIVLSATDGSGASVGSQSFRIQPSAPEVAARPRAPRSWSLDAFQEFNMQRVDSRAEQWARYHSAGLRARGKLGTFRWKGRLLLSALDRESEILQPQSRFELQLSHKYLELGVGDRQPQFGKLVLSGTRVRGLDLALKSPVARLRFVSGKTKESLDPLAGQGFGGTFQRDLTGFDLGFGMEDAFSGSLSLLTVRDDVGSITAQTTTAKPVDNLVLGTRFRQQFARGKFWLTQEAAFSLYNSNITGGVVDGSLLEDSLGLALDPGDFEDLIIINEYLSPLDIAENPLSSVALDAGMGLRVGKNELRADFQRVGPNYNSLGNAFLDNDRQRITIRDRVRLAQNQVYLDLGLGLSSDNLEGQYDNGPGTTSTSEYNLGLGWYPRQTDFKANLGFSLVGEENDPAKDGAGNLLRPADELSASLQQLTIGLSKDLQFLERDHRASLTVQNQTKGDDIGQIDGADAGNPLRRDLGFNSFQATLGLRSQIDARMRSRLTVGMYTHEYNDDVLGERSWWNLRASLERDWIPDELSTSFRFAFQGLGSKVDEWNGFTFDEVEDDYSRLDLGAQASWVPLPNLRLESRLDFQFYSGERGGEDLSDTDMHIVLRLIQTLK